MLCVRGGPMIAFITGLKKGLEVELGLCYAGSALQTYNDNELSPLFLDRTTCFKPH